MGPHHWALVNGHLIRLAITCSICLALLTPPLLLAKQSLALPKMVGLGLELTGQRK